MSADAASSLYVTLYQAMSDCLAEPSLKDASALAKEIATALHDLRRRASDAEAQQVIRLLLPVTFTILS